MNVRKFIAVSCGLSGVILAGLLTFQAVFPRLAERWSQQTTELLAYQKLLIFVAMFWSRLWWLAVPMVVVFAFLIVGLVFVMRATFSKGKRGTA